MDKLHFYSYNQYKNQLEHKVCKVEETAKCYKSAEFDQFGKRKSFPYTISNYVSKNVVDANNQNLCVILSKPDVDKARNFLVAQLNARRDKIWQQLNEIDEQINEVKIGNIAEIEI